LEPPPDPGRFIVLVANEYKLSEAYVWQAIEGVPGLDVIANISQWNSYSPEADQAARSHGIRVFGHSGLYGALNLSRQRIDTYLADGDR
jgi:hypothetical protein